jgi:FemAB-related protein (PEP-CTERM system-associated)
MFSIRLASENDQEKWDSYVSQNPDAGPYHWFGWKTAVEKGYGHKGYYLMAEGKDGICLGVLPLICMKYPWGRKSLVSLPYCDYAGPLGDLEVKKSLAKEALSLSEKLRGQGLELRFPEEQGWLENDSKSNSNDFSSKVRMLLTLPSGSSELWSGFKPKLRSQVKRPQKEGLKAEIGGREFLDDFYTVFNLNMHRLGSPVHDRRWFENLLQGYGEKAKVGVVRLKNGTPVAGGIILTSGRRACVPWASSLSEYNSIAPNMLLYHQFLAWSADNGFNQFDFGRSTPGEGTYRFKEQWGSSPQPLHWYKQGLNGVPKGEISSKTGARDKVASIWSKLPLPIANYLGPKLRKYISL